MKITGKCVLIPSQTNPGLAIVRNGFSVTKNGWTASIHDGLVTDGASIPWPFTIWLDKFDEDYILAAVVHDALVGQYNNPILVEDDRGRTRRLTWKEAAVWFRELMKADKDNGKFIRRVFYHAVMFKKRFRHLF